MPEFDAERSLALRVDRTWAADSAELARALIATDPTWGTEVFPMADGWAVFCGAGLYVNRLVGAGGTRPLTAHDLEVLESAARRVGVAASVDVPDFADESSRSLLRSRGYEPDVTVSVAVCKVERRRAAGSPVDRFELQPVSDALSLLDWQRAAALGWGHHTPERRRASDAYAAAASVAAGSSLLIVRDADDDRVVATCSLTVRDGLATLGGMSVLPAERRRGVQAVAIAARLSLARAAGCDLAATSTVVGGDSERNVVRHGFRPSHRVTTWRRNLPGEFV